MVSNLIVEALGLDDLKLVLFQLQNEVVVGLGTTKYVLYQIRVFFGWDSQHYQCVFGQVLIQSTNSCPVEILQKRKSRRVVFILALHDAEKVRVAFFREHWMGVCIRDLKK